MENNKPLLLVIDDESIILKTLRDALEDEDFRVHTLDQASQALEKIGQLVPDLVLLDIFMPEINGLDLLEKIKQEYPEQKIMMISGFGNISIALDAVKRGALDFIEKPLNLDEILEKIDFLKHLQRDGDEKFVKQVSRDIGEKDIGCHSFPIIGQSYLFQELKHHLLQIAKLDFPVLLYGLYGTGKSMLARYIHENSSLAKKTFLAFDCASKKNLESVVSFLSQTGSLYLKNIHALSCEHQKELLCHLEENKNNKKIRVIASSPVCLFRALQKEKFNPALFYFLNIVPVEIPPLNKRRYDIPLLVHYFLDRENKKHNKSIFFSTASIRLLRNHDWQGNVLELEQTIKKIVLLTQGSHIVITPRVLQEYVCEKNNVLIEEQSFVRFNSLEEASKAFEKRFLLYHLKKNFYNLDQTSDRLNLKIPQLRAKIQELRIDFKG